MEFDWNKRWPEFSPFEVLSPEGLSQFEKGVMLLQPHALDFLQTFRIEIGKPFIVNSVSQRNFLRGYRSPKENMLAGGKTYSYHMQGLAFDVTPVNMKVNDLFSAAIKFNWSGVGKYESFVHMDLRPILDGKQVVWKS